MRHRDIDSDDLSIALIIGAVALSYFGYTEFFPERFIEKFQTIITGLIALGVGYASVAAIKFQIAATETLAKQQLHELRASKTRAYATAVISYLDNFDWILQRNYVPITDVDICLPGTHKWMIPIQPPTIIIDSYYMADLSADDVAAMSRIGHNIRAISSIMRDTKFSEESQGLCVNKDKWVSIKRIYEVARSEISRCLSGLSHGHTPEDFYIP